ncbi:hypothetical protein KNSL1_012353 [Colletotrichum chrysophilum]|nr:hypothetical protein KNSL1_012353 [Colletotrichum chrysophilum]
MAVVYFETSWAILSTIGLANVLFGFMIAGITAFSPVSLIPIIVSAAGATANGLCYYSFYADYPILNTAISSAFADLLWMVVQEAGISFYSYAILTKVLRNRDRVVFMSLFWFMMVAIFVLRILILTARVKILVNGESQLRTTINGLHVGYFTSMALLECVGAYFLLRKFAEAKSLSLGASMVPTLFQHLMRSTEIRLAVLALIGITRAVAYFFQPSIQKAETVASQIDRFVYTLECMFPVIILVRMTTHLSNLPPDGIHSTNNYRVEAQLRRESGTSRSSLFTSENVGETIFVEDINERGLAEAPLPSGITKTIEIKIEKAARKPFDKE